MARLGWLSTTLFGALMGAGAALAPSAALAEIYGWVDPSGSVTYSNLPPPKNARVIDVIEETPPPTPQAQAAAAAAHEAEMRALNERVRQLEQELQLSRYDSAPPPPAYPNVPAPSYGPPPYTASYGPCFDDEFFDCGWGGGPVYYTAGVVPFWGLRHHRDHDRDGRFDRGLHRGPPGLGAPRFGASAHFAAPSHVTVASGGRGSSRSSTRGGPIARAH
jgi:hypothetical protein